MANCITDLISYDVFSIVLSYLDILDEHYLLWLISDTETRRRALLGWRRNTKYKITFDYGVTSYLVNGKLHRLNGPAQFEPHYSRWYFNGKLHRDNGPAYTYQSSMIQKIVYAKHGKCSRVDGPAVIYWSADTHMYSSCQDLEYYLDDLRHRPPEEGPAEIYWEKDKCIVNFWNNGVKCNPAYPYVIINYNGEEQCAIVEN